MINIYSRRSFLERLMLSGAAGGLASLLNVPPFVRNALAEGSIGTNGKKLIFLWFRFGFDGLNAAIPSIDPTYSQQRPLVYQMRVGQTGPTNNGGLANYNVAGAYGTNGSLNKMFDATLYKDLASTPRVTADETFTFQRAIPGGNGFLGFHPKMKFIAPVFNDGDMAVVHRVGYPYRTLSHFDSQRYWENAVPVTPTDKTGNVLAEGMLYRTMAEAITADPNGVGTRALNGVAIQSALPLLLRGSKYAMTNLADPLRYSLLGVPNNGDTRKTLTNALAAGKDVQFPSKGANREVLDLNFSNLSNTLETFADIDFTDAGAAAYKDSVVTDNDTDHAAANGGQGYNLFPTSNATNGGYAAHGNDPAKYVVPTNYTYIRNLKNLALTALYTEATIVGTEGQATSNDVHNNQVNSTNDPDDTDATPNSLTASRANGNYASNVQQLAWSFYALKRFFTRYGVGGSPADLAGKPTPTCSWNDVVVVAFSEFGRTSAGNTNNGTDHATGSTFFVGGGAVNGGIYCAHDTVQTNGNPASIWTKGTGAQDGTMFSDAGRYVQRCVDFRSIFGEIIRNHLGATQNQLNRIIPGYANEGTYKLLGGGPQADGITILGELGIV